jgi:hypothetical protein
LLAEESSDASTHEDETALAGDWVKARIFSARRLLDVHRRRGHRVNPFSARYDLHEKRTKAGRLLLLSLLSICLVESLMESVVWWKDVF